MFFGLLFELLFLVDWILVDWILIGFKMGKLVEWWFVEEDNKFESVWFFIWGEELFLYFLELLMKEGMCEIRFWIVRLVLDKSDLDFRWIWIFLFDICKNKKMFVIK